MSKLRTAIASVLAQPGVLDEFVSAYQSEKGKRTAMMLKGEGSLLRRAAAVAFPDELNQSNVEPGSTRYADMYFWVRGWHTGERFCRLVAEVENDRKELLGTLRDLLSFQSRTKWGVLYYDGDVRSAAATLEGAIKSVWHSFTENGLLEHPETEYEIVMLPDRLASGGILESEVCEARFRSRDVAMGASVRVVRLSAPLEIP